MDMKTLVVGQKVDLKSGYYSSSGEVVKITPSGVEVKMGGTLLLFDSDGNPRTSVDGNGTPECGPWELVNPCETQVLVKDQEPMANRYNPIKGSAVAASVSPEFLKKAEWVVGQRVRMTSGCYGCEGTVVDVSPSGVVEVQTEDNLNAHQLLHFDNNGTGRDAEGTCEAGPWELEKIPLAERTAPREQESACQRKMG
jgi:hypothetical protein